MRQKTIGFTQQPLLVLSPYHLNERYCIFTYIWLISMIIYWEIIYLHRVHDIHGTGIFTYIYHTKINHSCIFGSYDQGHGHPPLELQNSGNQRLRLIAFHVQVIPTYPTGSMYVWYIYLREWLIFYGKCRKIYPSRWIFWVLGFMLLDNRHAFWIFSL